MTGASQFAKERERRRRDGVPRDSKRGELLRLAAEIRLRRLVSQLPAEFRVLGAHPGYFACADGGIYSGKSGALARVAEAPDEYGYLIVQLTRDGRTYSARVNRLVCEGFHGAPTGPEARHLDGDKNNNRPENLAWGTQRENAADRDRHGHTARGERNGGGQKLTEEQAREIKLLARSRTMKHAEIAERFGVSTALVSHINTGRLWRFA